jgi:hypothetical protein
MHSFCGSSSRLYTSCTDDARRQSHNWRKISITLKIPEKGEGKAHWERRYRKGEKDILTEIEEMARAVIAGNCEQKGGPFWLYGKIHASDYTYKMMYLAVLPISSFWTRHYAPFVTIATGCRNE